eukprot:jgi/Ulvmu1/2316/UM013_0164.1
MFGIEDEDRLNEPLGSALCVPGRMLCWPNALQHRVAPFKLADATRPGVRIFTAVFLVDPHVRVVSTRDVPPQQMEWHDAESRLGSTIAMPDEVKRKVDALRDFPISLERAKELRLELMEERRTIVRTANHEVYGAQVLSVRALTRCMRICVELDVPLHTHSSCYHASSFWVWQL